MKTTITFLTTATVLGFASLTSNHSIDAAEALAITFAAGLVAWAVSEYSREPRPLKRRASVVPFAAPRAVSTTSRLAA